jgi:circadian clock protein KaiC
MPQRADAPLLPTAVPGLDTVLGGGLPRGVQGVIIGPSGAGKTVLAGQIAFATAQAGVPVLVLTLYSEGHVKLLDHLRSFTFFDAAAVGRTLTLLALQPLVAADPAATAATLSRTIRETGAQLVVIDGLQGLDVLLDGPRALHQVLGWLSSQLSYLGATLLMTLVGDARSDMTGPALTTADLIINLAYTLEAGRHMRRLEVVKQRGRAPLPGQHAYLLDAHGVTVLPRLESRPRPVNQPRGAARAAFALPELNRLLDGGLPVGSSTVLAGGLGAGKTTLGLHWALAAAGTLWLSFGEYAEQLRAHAQAFGLPLAAAVDAGTLRFVRISPVDVEPDIVAEQLLTCLADGPVQRLVIDDAAALLQVLGARLPSFCGALREHLYAAGVTSLVLFDIEPGMGFQISQQPLPLSVLSDHVLVLQQCEVHGRFHRALAVLRMRNSAYDPTLRELVISAAGVRVLRPEETDAAVGEALAQCMGGLVPT